MFGPFCCAPSVRGALGFSNEKSLEYWTRTASRGVVFAACPVPLPFCSAILFAPSPFPRQLVGDAIGARPSTPSAGGTKPVGATAPRGRHRRARATLCSRPALGAVAA